MIINLSTQQKHVMITVQCQTVVFEEIAAILWDKDGTLADSHPFLKQLAWVRSQQVAQWAPGIEAPLLKAFGCDGDRYDPTGLMAVGTRYENEIAAAAFLAAAGKSWAEALGLVQQAFRDSDRSFTRKADLTPPLPGVPALLQQCQQQGLKMAVLSGDTTANIEDFLQRYRLDTAITWWAGSEAPPVKPDPQMVWTACEKLGVAPHHCLLIGDSDLDAQLAQSSGCRALISVTWGGSGAIAGAAAVLDQPEQFRCVGGSRHSLDPHFAVG